VKKDRNVFTRQRFLNITRDTYMVFSPSIRMISKILHEFLLEVSGRSVSTARVP